MTTVTFVLLYWIIRGNLTAFQTLQLLCLSVVTLVPTSDDMTPSFCL